MTTIGVVFLSLLFIILILGVYIIGQQDTIKHQNKTINEMQKVREY